MQLFITDNFEIKTNQIYIYDEEIIHQLTKVLRAKIWDHIYIQKNNISWTQKFTESITRYNLQIYEIQKSQIITNMYKSEIKWKVNEVDNNQNKSISIAVPFMNKREKYDRVVQKLWEIWIDEIIFWRSERSIIHDLSQNKIQRYQKILKEAAEQSRWISQANIYIVNNIHKHLQKYSHIYIADYDWVKISSLENLKWNILLIIWPEGWLTWWEITKFENANCNKVILWRSVLRTETAAIIWWRWLKNL